MLSLKTISSDKRVPHTRTQKNLTNMFPDISVLIGGFTMRYIVVYAGQMAQVISS
jgi:formate-dependent nitrite reductase membrane component NrfD